MGGKETCWLFCGVFRFFGIFLVFVCFAFLFCFLNFFIWGFVFPRKELKQPHPRLSQTEIYQGKKSRPRTLNLRVYNRSSSLFSIYTSYGEASPVSGERGRGAPRQVSGGQRAPRGAPEGGRAAGGRPLPGGRRILTPEISASQDGTAPTVLKLRGV